MVKNELKQSMMVINDHRRWKTLGGNGERQKVVVSKNCKGRKQKEIQSFYAVETRTIKLVVNHENLK